MDSDKKKPTARELGLNPRALGLNPRSLGTNAKALAEFEKRPEVIDTFRKIQNSTKFTLQDALEAFGKLETEQKLRD